MTLNSLEIKAFGKTIFHKVIFKTPLRYTTNLVEENRACFFYIVEGEYRTFTNSSATLLSSKDGVVKKCGSYISNYLKVVGSETCEAIAIYLYPEILKEIYKDEIPSFLKKSKRKNILRKVSSSELVDRYIQSLLFYFENPELTDEDLVIIKLKELILLLLKTEKDTTILELVSDFFNPERIPFKETVETHIYSEITVEELAFLCNLSLSSFKREFKRIYQESPARYIRNKKLGKAAGLLAASDMRINDIAFQCGLDMANFPTIFRRKYNVSPSEYRLSQNKNKLS